VPDAYELQLERAARRTLRRLPERDYRRLERVIDDLARDPRPRGALKLGGRLGSYRLRVSEYRVIYAVFDAEKLLKIVDVERRTTQTYRRLNS
jgi:mRNA interferase RelE/StbE